uniref:Uncharacterized protein n=1 Tax=Strombidinopsis acuminata TaxID=141414 RepID=A0A7S3SIT2_9SPIT|mmetsp:Transcript_33995/g.45778  ORF Transcript_33995/g.45778 Transcript_33995/m.45778 type:complete len:140 (+) Transcript_33995:2-421(+)
MDIGGVWHGMESFYLKNGINRPDMQGIACDGKEAVNHNPFSSGWEWLGPGPRMKGVRQQLMDFLQSRCTKPGTPLAQQLIGQCWFMDGWSLAIGEMQEETAQALISAPSQVARRDDTATVRSSRSIETSAYSHEAVYSR